MASGFTDGSYFLLLKTISRKEVWGGRVFEIGNMIKGAILMEDSSYSASENHTNQKELKLWSIEEKSAYVTCDMTDVVPLTPEECELLLPIADLYVLERLRVYNDKELLQFGLLHDRCIGQHVRIRLPNGRDSTGNIRYVGKLTERVGTWFGIELDEVRFKETHTVDFSISFYNVNQKKMIS